jgi:sRNA-binding carbon storage regulator CsrA
MLCLDIRVGESVAIGDAVIRLEKKDGRSSKIVIFADRSIPVRLLRAGEKHPHTPCEEPIASG